MSSEAAETPMGREPISQSQLPPVGEPVWVECGTYRTLAYRDEKGVWRTVAKREPVEATRILGQ